MESNFINKIICKKYQILQYMKPGTHSSLYQGINIQTNTKVAIKIERKSYKIKELLKEEAEILSRLFSNYYTPILYCYAESKTHNFLIEELLSLDLDELFSYCNNKFSLQTICHFAIEMIKILRLIHNRNIIHRNLTPSKLMIGIEDSVYDLHLVNFKLIKQYKNDNEEHIPLKGKMHPVGDLKFCSVNSLLRYELSRRDDLESVGYILIYLSKGYLPWDELKLNKNENMIVKIEEKKKFITIETLCKELPRQFKDYMRYVKGLEFEAEPDYQFLINLFSDLKIQNSYNVNSQRDFEWNSQSVKKVKEYKEGVVSYKNCDQIETIIFNFPNMHLDKTKALTQKVLKDDTNHCACVIF